MLTAVDPTEKSSLMQLKEEEKKHEEIANERKKAEIQHRLDPDFCFRC